MAERFSSMIPEKSGVSDELVKERRNFLFYI